MGPGKRHQKKDNKAIHEISTCGDRMKNTLPVDQSRGSETILKKEYDVVGKTIKLL